MRPPLPSWRKTDNFSRMAHQRLVEKLNAHDTLNMEAAMRPKQWRRIGYIVAEGPLVPSEEPGGEPEPAPDFDDARYWVHLSQCEPAESDATGQTDVIKFTGEPEVTGQPHIICATNLCELPPNGAEGGGTHFLSPGDHVTVKAIGERQNGVTATVFVFERAADTVTVRVDSDRTGRAWYAGHVWKKPTGEANTTTAPNEATAGTEGVEVSILNLQEAGAASASVTGHDLTNADNVAQRLFKGFRTGQVDEEDRPVVHIGGFWAGPCVVAES